MGMKNINALRGMLAMAMMFDPSHREYYEDEEVKRVSKPPIRTVPFHKQENILKMISDYKLIKSGQSKKGKIKQARIVNLIEKYLRLGSLTEDNLK